MQKNLIRLIGPRPGSRTRRTDQSRLPVHMERTFELLHTTVKRRRAVVLPKWLGILPATVLVAALATMNFLVGIGQPAHPIWDERYYLTAAQRYEDGTAQFASHPPLGLLLIAAGDALLHPNRGTDTRAIGWDKQVAGERLPEHYSFAGVRLMSGVFAVIGAVLFFAVMLTLTRSVFSALLLSNLYVFENAFIAHFRAAHLDAFQVAFALAALLCFAVSVRRGKRSSSWLEFALGAACGLAIMVKLNAVLWILLGLMLIVRRIRLGWHSAPRARLLLTGVLDGMVMASGCLLAIVAVWTIHVAVTPHPPPPGSPAGVKDKAFMSHTYQAYLNGERGFSPLVVLAAAQDYTRFMLTDLKGVPKNDQNGSRPMDWPLHIRTINYRWDSDGVHTAYVQLVGNIWGWLMAGIALVATVGLLILQWWRPCQSSNSERRELMVMLLLQYLAFMTVHAFLGTMRVMYLYHYFLALVLAFCLVPLVLAEAAERWRVLRAWQESELAVITVLLLVSFAFYSPLSFHRPLTHAQCEWRNAVQHIVDCR
ncbi:MAG: phospholipid carrier-dependent glycosyltransferase [Gammaproteobacteria bacterium]|nr:phospholipid carrier-dependent glycosyltransferase [Gammaproteobacteria bacterium]